MKYLGIDYGKRKVGLAISEGISASPFKVLEVSSLADALMKVMHIIEKEEIDQVVVGVSDGGGSKSMTEQFTKKLREEVDVILADETLSSHFADHQMRELGVQKSKRSHNDAHAAAIILQEYLDRKNEG